MAPRWLIAGLIASVALNLVLIGAGAGVLALGARLAHQAGAARPGALLIVSAALPQPDRKNFRQMLRSARDEVRADADRSLAMRSAAWAAVAGGKPDAAAIKADLAQSRQIDIAVRAKVEERIVDYALGMPAADRAIFAAGMKRVLTPPPRPAASNATAASAAQ